MDIYCTHSFLIYVIIYSMSIVKLRDQSNYQVTMTLKIDDRERWSLSDQFPDTTSYCYLPTHPISLDCFVLFFTV